MRLTPTAQQATLRRYAYLALLTAVCALRCGYAVHRVSGWVLDRLEAVARRQRQHASDLAVLAGLEPIPEGLRSRR